MNRWLFTVVLLVGCLKANSQSVLVSINNELKRIDLFDGSEDSTIQLNDVQRTAVASNFYFKRIGQTIDLIKQKENFDLIQRQNYMVYVLNQLQEINKRNYTQIDKLNHKQDLIDSIIKNLDAPKRLSEIISENPRQSIALSPFFKTSPVAEAFFAKESVDEPELFLANYNQLSDQSWAAALLDKTAAYAPHLIKKYMSNSYMSKPIYASKEPAVKALAEIYRAYGVKSNAYSLIDLIATGEISAQQADSISRDEDLYYKALCKIKQQANYLGDYTLEQELEYQSLRIVREVNNLHDNSNFDVRFAGIKELNPQQLYFLMVYSQDEIFTSSFLGIFDNMMQKNDSSDSYQLLKSVSFNRFRTFIKLCSGFNTLNRFLSDMSETERNDVLKKFIENLAAPKTDLRESVDVADALGSINDVEAMISIEKYLRYNYLMEERKENQRGVVIYGLLGSLYKEKAIEYKYWFMEIANQFQLPDLSVLTEKALYNEQGKDVQIHFFFDDDDGKASFASFEETFRQAKWMLKPYDKFLSIMSRDSNVIILANYPKFEEDGGQEAMLSFCDTNHLQPNVMVHRGHSYYANKTIDQLNEKVSLVFLGSCGGYHRLSDVLTLSPDIQIISSKQIGTMFVNNPLLLEIANQIDKKEDIKWENLWQKVRGNIGNNPTALSRFDDYIPPHKNMGAQFIQAYNMLMKAKK